MPGDYSRKTFAPLKHYSGVLMQQGRVQLDADWNEQLAIRLHRTETEARDLIGPCGVPRESDGFKIGTTPDGKDLTISPGRIYVDGLLCELEGVTTYITQPDFPHPDHTSPLTSPPTSPPSDTGQLSLEDGTYLVFLDVWQREITALEDPLLREVALGGPDTTTRLKTVWQVKLLRVSTGIASPPASPPTSPPGGEVTCGTAFPELDQYTAPSTGRLNARAQAPEPQKDPCRLSPSAGFRGLENQLYRVEVHTGGARNVATFKWSRENASVETSIEKIDGNLVTVTDIGKDEVLGFAGGQWVEIVDEESTLKSWAPGTPRPLVQIDGVDPATREIRMKTPVAPVAPVAPVEKALHPRLRRWDQAGANAGADGMKMATAAWIDLESGIQVQFSEGHYHSGDYWLIPARTATGEIEWPPFQIPNLHPIPQPPRGIRHHFCRLALIEAGNGAVTSVEDCRELFPPLTRLTHLSYLSGDGQEAMPGQRLPAPFQAGVTHGQWPVPGAKVRFTLTKGNGTLEPGTSPVIRHTGAQLIASTGQDGVAECFLRLGLQNNPQVEAALLDSSGNPLPPGVRFNANLSVAGQVAYDPRQCPDLAEAGVRTVQEAIDRLCQRAPEEEPGIRIREVLSAVDGAPLLNDTLVPVSRLLRGVRIVCDAPIAEESVGEAPGEPPSRFPPDRVAGKPTCRVTLDLPYPLGREGAIWDFAEIIGFQPLILGSRVTVRENEILWRPTDAARTWLEGLLFRGLGNLSDRVLAHLTLKGNFIWLRDSSERPIVYLDGEAFGRPLDGRVALRFPTGNGRRGGDFEMWFWLVQR